MVGGWGVVEGGAGAHRGGEPGVPGARGHAQGPSDTFSTPTRRLTTYHHLSPPFCGGVGGWWVGGGVVAGGAGANGCGEPGVPGARGHVPGPPDAFRTPTRRLTTYHCIHTARNKRPYSLPSLGGGPEKEEGGPV